MRTIFRSELVWQGNNKLGSLRQRNCVWRVANRTDQGHLCLWYFGRGFGYARNFEGLHAVCARVRSFHRGSFVKLSISSSMSRNPATPSSDQKRRAIVGSIARVIHEALLTSKPERLSVLGRDLGCGQPNRAAPYFANPPGRNRFLSALRCYSGEVKSALLFGPCEKMLGPNSEQQ